MSARAPTSATAPASASPYGMPVKSAQKEPQLPSVDHLLMELVGEAVGNENVAQWYVEALEIKRLYQGMSREEKNE